MHSDTAASWLIFSVNADFDILANKKRRLPTAFFMKGENESEDQTISSASSDIHSNAKIKIQNKLIAQEK